MNWDKDEIFNLLKEIIGNAKGIFKIAGMDYDYNFCPDTIFLDEECNIPINRRGNYTIYRGIDKIVIIPFNCDYVIKIPFTGICEIDSNDNFFLSETITYNPFEDENDRRTALNFKAQDLFLENIFIGYYNNRFPIYLQEKVITFKEKEIEIDTILSNNDYKLIDSVTEGCLVDCVTIIDPQFCYDIIKWYGEERAHIMFQECGYFDDLHAENYGYLENGRPVIFDYAEDEC